MTHPLSVDEMTLFRALLGAQSTVLRQLEADLLTHGTTLSEYEILVWLSESPRRCLRMSELADAVLLSRSGLTRAVDRLAKRGFVERRRCPDDARGWLAVLQPAGLAHLRSVYPVHLASVRRHVVDRVPVALRPAVTEALLALSGRSAESLGTGAVDTSAVDTSAVDTGAVDTAPAAGRTTAERP